MKLLLTLAALFVVGLGLRADDAPKKDQPFTGTWTKSSAEGVELGFSFRTKDELTLTAAVGDAQLKATCKYAYDADKKRIRAVVTKTEVKGDFPQTLEKGFVMIFKLAPAADGATAKLTDYEADNADQVRDIVEGVYKAKKAD